MSRQRKTRSKQRNDLVRIFEKLCLPILALLVPKSDHGVDAHGAAGGDETRRHGHRQKDENSAPKRQQIRRAHAKKQSGEQLAERECPHDANRHAEARELQPLRSFVLPGGTPAASFLHLARTVSRRAERHMVALASRPNEPVGDAALRYINRLSDFLFVAARYANDKGKSDVLWVPGQNR